MKHLGDISKIKGAEIDPVDIITFGSPCQDLSVAGKGAGLSGSRSGLFMEAVRIIREMREATDGKYPRFALWENVPGAFSSNKGEDFRIVLEELIKIAEPGAVMPAVPPFGWAYADNYVGDGWSLAYRVFDTQYWPRTPQRRRRIYLVADFRGQRAREILFEREGLRGHLTEGGTAGQETAGDAGGRLEAGDRTEADVAYGFPLGFRPENVRMYEEAGTTICNGTRPGYTNAVLVQSAGFKQGQGCNARNIGWEAEKSPTLASQAGGNSVPSVCVKTWDARGKGDGETIGTLTGDHEARVTDYSSLVVYNGETITSPQNKTNPRPGDPCHTLSTDSRNLVVIPEAGVYCLQGNTVDRDAKQNGFGLSEDTSHTLNAVDRHGVVYCMAHGQANAEVCEDHAPTLNCNHEQPIVFDKEVFQSGENATGGHYISEGGPAPALRTTGHPPGVCVAGMDCRNGKLNDDLCGTLQAKANGGFSYNCIHPVLIQTPSNYIVRRLTPTECARLQGFPDKWGHPEPKEELTDAEYRFWLDVRNTHAALNGKAVKEYSKEQILKWYNKLHSDTAEYKMWGNGIALPPTLYCMQGIAEALNT